VEESVSPICVRGAQPQLKPLAVYDGEKVWRLAGE
jgi:hypothetical protein